MHIEAGDHNPIGLTDIYKLVVYNFAVFYSEQTSQASSNG